MNETVSDLNDALSANYMLVDLQVRSWSGKRTDREASDELLERKQAAKDGGAFVKNLLASASGELKLVQQCASTLRHFVYHRTLPWSSTADGGRRTGDRVIASALAMDFLQDMKGPKAEYDNAVRALVAVWDLRVTEAMRALGQLARADDYPTAVDLPEMFSVRIDMRPIPTYADFTRLNIPVQLAQGLAARHAAAAQVQVNNAMADLRDRIIEELTRINTQMAKHASGEKTKLYESLITNMQGLVQMARNMNLTNNPKLAELADRIEMKLLQHPVEVYKNDKQKAAVIAADAHSLATDAAIEEFWK